MLLVVDVGNTNTVLGVFSASACEQGSRLLAHWRVSTIRTQTVDEYGVLFRNLFAGAGLEVGPFT
jgi:type III pantothenate kinase